MVVVVPAGESVYERPEDYVTPREGEGSDWAKYEDDDGEVFYYNEKTNESVYERPGDYKSPREEGDGDGDGGADGGADAAEAAEAAAEDGAEESAAEPDGAASPKGGKKKKKRFGLF